MFLRTVLTASAFSLILPGAFANASSPGVERETSLSRKDYVEQTFANGTDVAKNRLEFFTLDREADRQDAELYQLTTATRDPYFDSKKLGEALFKMNSDWERLSLYPGLVQRAAEFILFANHEPDKTIPAANLYEKFKIMKGMVSLYRGIGVTEAELKEIRADGIRSTSLKRNLFSPGQKMTGIHQQIVNREKMSSPEQDHLVSATHSLEMAKWFAQTFGDDKNGRKLVILKFRVPVIELIDAGPNGIIQLKNFDKTGAELVESFVPFLVSPDEIVSVELLGE